MVSGNADSDPATNGSQTSYRGDKAAYIVKTHSDTIPGYVGNMEELILLPYTSIPIPLNKKCRIEFLLESRWTTRIRFWKGLCK